jgi:hypothetical protein
MGDLAFQRVSGLPAGQEFRLGVIVEKSSMQRTTSAACRSVAARRESDAIL